MNSRELEAEAEVEIELELQLDEWEESSELEPLDEESGDLELELELEQTLARAYGVELLFEGHPPLPVEEMIERIQTYCGDIEVAQKSHMLIIFFKEYHVPFAGGEVHPSLAVMLPYEQVHKERGFEPALMHSWRLEEANSLIASCDTCMLITDLMAQALPYKVRMALFQRALYAIVEACPCNAIHFRLSEQFIARSDYLANHPNDETYNPLLGLLNVRHANDASDEELFVMDTMGLAAIGLPDIELKLSTASLGRSEAAELLYSSGEYLFQHGDVTQDIDKLLAGSGRRFCRTLELSSLPPRRNVLQLQLITSDSHDSGKNEWTS